MRTQLDKDQKYFGLAQEKEVESRIVGEWVYTHITDLDIDDPNLNIMSICDAETGDLTCFVWDSKTDDLMIHEEPELLYEYQAENPLVGLLST